MSHKLAPNKQATQSLEVQHVELPSDLSLAAIQCAGTVNLCRLEGGSLMLELSDTLQEAARASYNLSKKAKVTLTIEFVPGGARQMDIQTSISAKIPKEERAGTRLFVTDDGQLSAYDPAQQRLDLRVIKHTDVEAKIIDVRDEAPRDVLGK